MGTPVGSMQVELGLEASSFNASLTASKRAVNYFKAEIRGLDSALRVSGNNVQTLSAKQKTLKQAMEAQAKVLANLKKKHDDLEASGRKGSAEWEANAVAIQRANAEMSNLESQLVSVGKAMDELTKKPLWFEKWQEAGKKLQGFGDGLQTVAKETALISGTVGAGLVAAAKSAMEFESAWTGVKKTVDGTPEQLEAVKNGIRQMALEIPASTTEIAGVAEAAGQLGVATEDVLGFTRTMLDLAQSTNMTSEQASTSLARFAKITDLVTQHGVDGYSRLGSAIVELGNNTATTESEIVDLGMRLAAAGTQVGLTQAEIMGLAASMSSVGLSAEAGGTAMSTIMTKINTAVAEGGERLGEFASIAGMTAEEFATLWKDKPTEALELFTKGLGEALESGENVDAMLKELGVNGIRETDAIKRLGLAHKDLAKNFKMANAAFKDNSALSKEASQRYETMESKLQLLKNKLNDVAIEVGGPVIDALSDMIDAGEPVFELIKKMATGFSNLDKDTQRLLLTIAGLTAGFSPVIGGLGKLISWTGRVTKGVGLFGQTINGLKVAKVASDATSAGTAMAGMATQVTGVTSAVGGLSTKAGLLASLFTPTGAVVVGTVAAAGALAYLGVKAAEAEDRLQTWGTAVSKEQARELSEFKTKVDEVSNAMMTFGHGAPEQLEAVTTSVRNLKEAIVELANTQLEKDKELIGRVAQTAEQEAEMTQKSLDNHRRRVESTENMTKQIEGIYRRHAENNTQITEQEQRLIDSNMRGLIETQLDMLDYSAKEKKKILTAIYGEVKDLTQKQLDNRQKVIEDHVAKVNQAHEKEVKDLESSRKKGLLTEEQYVNNLKTINAKHEGQVKASGQKLGEIYSEQIKRLTEARDKWLEGDAGWHHYNNQIIELEKALAGLGDSYEANGKKAGGAMKLLAENTADATQQQIEANAIWNSLTFDEKDMSIRSDAREAIKQSLEAENGWNDLHFMLKEANLTSDAKMQVGLALLEVGKWDELSPEEKELILQASPAIEALTSSEEALNRWNGLASEDKDILATSEKAVRAVTESEERLQAWNSLPAEVKELLGDNAVFMEAAKGAEAFLEGWNTLTPEEKELRAQNLVGATAEEASQMINEVRQLSPVDINASNKVLPQTSSAQSDIDSVHQSNPADIYAANQTASTVAEAQATMDNGLHDVFRDLNAMNMTAQPTLAAQGTMNTLADVSRNLNAQNMAVGPKNQTQATMNSLRDVERKLTANGSSVPRTVSQTQGSVNSLRGKSVDLRAVDYGSSTAYGFMGVLNSIPRSITTVLNTVKNFVGLEKGTDFHEGGAALVNDQKGPLYKEMVTLPTGESFIPDGRNILLDLPRGSKVLTATRTRNLMNKLSIPKYADGVGIPEDARFLRDIERSERAMRNNGSSGGNDGAILAALQAILNQLQAKEDGNQTLNLELKLGHYTLDEFALEIGRRLQKQERYRLRSSTI